MKSQMLTILLLIIGAFFFRPTHQYLLSKRELTEYDLTSFIVGTCSAGKADMIIQSLCDQTLQSALMGNFPFLTYYCKTIGAGMSYCNSINRHTIINQNAGAKQRFVYRRLARSLNEDNKLNRERQELEQKLIIQNCITNTEKSSVDTNQFCNRALQEVQRGRYPEIKHFCKYYPSSDYCRHVRFYSSPLHGPSSLHSIIPNINPSHVSSSVSKPSGIETIIDQQRNNNQNQDLSSSSS